EYTKYSLRFLFNLPKNLPRDSTLRIVRCCLRPHLPRAAAYLSAARTQVRFILRSRGSFNNKSSRGCFPAA
ncbi:MAG: hypothetical protein ACLTOS_14025, partial [Ruthenibacterium lactatiformans]